MTTQTPGNSSAAATPGAPTPPAAQPAPRREPKHDPDVLNSVMDETLKYRYALEPTTQDEARVAANDAFRAKLVASVEEAVARISIGRPMGLPAFAAIQKVHLLENKRTGLVTPCIAASAKLALCLSHKAIEYVEPRELTATSATWAGKRKGGKEVLATFTIEDAKRAMLVGRGGGAEGGNNYDKYPVDMLSWRACGRLCDRIGADVLMGIATYEDIQDEFRAQAEEMAAAAARGELAQAVGAPPPQAATARDFVAESDVLKARIAAAPSKAELTKIRPEVAAFAEVAPKDLGDALKRLYTAAGKAERPPAPTAQAAPPAAPTSGQAPAPVAPAASTQTPPASSSDTPFDDGDDLGGRM